MVCAVCSIDLQSGRTGTHATSRLCRACKKDPANDGWLEKDVLLEHDANLEQTYGAHAVIQLGERPLRPVTERQKQILFLLTFGIEERVPRIDKYGRRDGYRRVRRAVSERECARIVGCSRKLVHLVFKSIFG